MKKQITFGMWMAIMAISCMFFTGCGDDDDDNGGSQKGNGSVATCKSVIDGRNTEYKYAYLLADEVSPNTYEYGMYFATFDCVYYLTHPNKIPNDVLGSAFMIDIYPSTPSHDKNLPLGEFSHNEYSCEIELNIPISYLIGEDMDEDYPEPFYTTDWERESSPLVISKNKGNYRIEVNQLKLLASEPGAESVGQEDRKTTGSFYFEGVPGDISDYIVDEGEDETRSAVPSGLVKKHKRLILKLERK